jgi:hypothetical protein
VPVDEDQTPGNGRYLVRHSESTPLRTQKAGRGVNHSSLEDCARGAEQITDSTSGEIVVPVAIAITYLLPQLYR